MPLLESIATNAIGGAMGLALGGINDARQVRQQKKMQDMQIQGQKEMTDYNTQKAYGMWLNTGVKGQMDQIKKAGLNPALMYSGGGGGGGSTAISTGNVSAGNAPTGGRETQDMISIGMQMKAQNELLQAQKENIEADTVNKKAETTYTGGVKTANTQANTSVQQANSWSTGLDNAVKDYLQRTDLEGKETTDYGSTMKAESERQKLNMQNADNALRGKQWEEIAKKIEIMGKQGLNIEAVTENLAKDGTIKDAEIAWNKLGLKQGDAGKFIVELIKKLIKGR